MTDVQPLQALLAQTERERDAALAGHQRALATELAARQQADQLRDYRRDYEVRWQREFAQAGRMELVHCYQAFMERLTMAVESQGRIVREANGHVERASHLLRDHEMRCASVRKLIERRLQERRNDGERQAQRQLDEFSARAAWNRLAEANHSHTA